jgi:hypothetical protein
MRPINARGDLDHESPVPFCPKAMHFQTEHGRGDGGDGGAAQGTLVGLVELADIDSPGRRLWASCTPKTITPPPLFAIAATSLGKSVCGSPLAGGNSDFQSRSLVSTTPAATAASRSSSVSGPGPTPRARWSAVKLMVQA